MKFIGTLCGLTATAIWGGRYVVNDVVLRIVPPFTLLIIRLILGMISLSAMVVYTNPGACSFSPEVR